MVKVGASATISKGCDGMIYVGHSGMQIFLGGLIRCCYEVIVENTSCDLHSGSSNHFWFVLL